MEFSESSIENLAYELIFNRLVPRYPQDHVSVTIGDVLTQAELELICTDRLQFARLVDLFAEQAGRKAYFEETVLGTTESIYWAKIDLPLS